MIVLGIDPGFSSTGYAVLKKEGQKIFLIDCGYLALPVKNHLSKKIGIFYRFLNCKVLEYKITDISLETSFLGKNAQNFLKLGYLRAILYLLADLYGLGIIEFSPRQIKQAVTGFGGAEKDQVARAILTLFPHLKAPKKTDVTDALAVGICGIWSAKVSMSEKI